MKKTTTVIIIFILAIKMNGQNLDNLYANATLNSDYTSTISASDDTNILKEDFTKWLIDNKTKFNFENGVNIVWNNKWYWGSYKTVFHSLTFIKPENYNQRIAYLEQIKKNNSGSGTGYSALEILQGINEFLQTSQGKSVAKYIGNAVSDGWESFKENMKNSYSSDNSISSNTMSNNTSECELKGLKEYEKLKGNKTTGLWEDKTLSQHKKQRIEFSTNYYGYIFKDDEGNYYIDDTSLINHYYKDYESVVYALYIYKRCDFITEINKKNN